MKTFKLMFYSFLIMNMCLLAGCDKDEVSREIPVTDISTDFFNFPNKVDDVIIINDNKKLNNYTKPDVELPEIDFSKQTLLLARGGSPQWVDFVLKKLIKQSSKRYTLEVDVQESGLTLPGAWYVAVLTEKLPSKSDIKLNVTIHNWNYGEKI